jgi:hypothetical protein
MGATLLSRCNRRSALSCFPLIGLDGRLTAFGPAHVEATSEVHVVPAQADKLAGSQRMAVGDQNCRAMVQADSIEATGDEWSLVYWNPETGEYLDAIDDLVVREIDRPIGLVDSLSGTEA